MLRLFPQVRFPSATHAHRGRSYDAVGIDENDGWNGGDTEGLLDVGNVVVANDVELYIVRPCPLLNTVVIGVVVAMVTPLDRQYLDGQFGRVGFCGELAHLGHFSRARPAPCRPKVKHHDLPTEFVQVHDLSIDGGGDEVRCRRSRRDNRYSP